MALHFRKQYRTSSPLTTVIECVIINNHFSIFSDEATRPDRQPEFTQLDIELSFTDREHIIALVENVLTYSWPDKSKIVTPFERITYDEAMEKYGSDKPDTRFDIMVADKRFLNHIAML